MRRPVPKGEVSLDKWISWLEHLRDASKTRIVVCQHKKECDLLKDLGCENVVYVTEPEYDFIQKLVDSGKECLLLFDTDRNSNKKCQLLRSKLEHRGVKVSTRFRKIFYTIPCRAVEGVWKYLHRLIGSDRVHKDYPL